MTCAAAIPRAKWGSAQRSKGKALAGPAHQVKRIKASKSRFGARGVIANTATIGKVAASTASATAPLAAARGEKPAQERLASSITDKVPSKRKASQNKLMAA